MNRILLILLGVVLTLGVTHVRDVPLPNKEVHVWTTADSKAYAKDVLNTWSAKEFKCLNILWKKESNWRHNAYNSIKVMGKNAGGIPQLLGMSPSTPPTQQIDRGFSYILYRYGTPCEAWTFHKKNGWY